MMQSLLVVSCPYENWNRVDTGFMMFSQNYVVAQSRISKDWFNELLNEISKTYFLFYFEQQSEQ